MKKHNKYPQSMVQQGIINKETLQKRLIDIFEQAEHQESALVNIYRLIFPDWEKITQVEGFPEVGKDLWKYICQLFIHFDSQHHPNVFNGGIWLNNGFSSNDRLDGWAISLENCHLIYA